MKICIGIISYIPDDNKSDRRKQAITDLIDKINDIFCNIPIIIIAQNWKDFDVNSRSNITKYISDKPLGILQARKELRRAFLNSEYDYLIMLDDDSKIIGTNGLDYIKEIMLHPDGFGWFSNHLLKLFAISKYVYSRIDMPDIDAEKLQGFEDKIFISMCRIKFPEREFEFDRSKLDEISYGDTDGPPSTWWSKDIARHRQELRNKTDDYIKNYAKENNVDFKVPPGLINDDNYQRTKIQPVDIVVTYVNNKDEEWIKLYNEYSNTVKYSDQTSSQQRFRDDINSVLYCLRSIDKNCPWINKIFFVVQSKSQLPNWLNINNKKLRIVYHNEYIPEELLPTFNSNVIEMFLPRLKDLSDNYIVCNDDMFFMNYVERSMFFSGNLPVYECKSLGRKYRGIDDFMKTIVNNYNFLHDVIKIDTHDYDYKMSHYPLPHKKYIENYLLEKYYDNIIGHFNYSHFRNTANITHWMYCDYLKHLNLCTVNKNLYINSMHATLRSRLDFEGLESKDLLCINDTLRTDNYEKNSKRLAHFLSLNFPDRCQFEIDDTNSGVKFEEFNLKSADKMTGHELGFF